MIDLHCHSLYSDGALSPSDLLSKALEANLKVLALTDHDTTLGLSELHHAAIGKDICIINGVEISTSWKKYDVHILGLNIDPKTHGLSELMIRQNERRTLRAEKMGDLLKACGVVDAYSKVCQRAGHFRVGRAHYAALLIEEGLVHDMQSAFKRYLGRGKPAYVPTQWASLEEAVEAILEAKGEAVIAHPMKYGLTRTKLQELIKAFKNAGGTGLEVVSGHMTMEQLKEIAGLSCRFKLLASSGSDFHSDTVSPIKLGRQVELPKNCTPIWQSWMN